MTREEKLFCKEIVMTAGKNLLTMHSMKIEEKTDWNNLVTSCDKATQEYLMEELSKVDSQATFLCEENDVCDTSGEHFFIIDPIDGTSNFICDYQLSCICVAYADHKNILWGMVYNPYMNEFYEAELGQGAYLNGRKIQVSKRPLKASLINMGTSPYYQEWQDITFELARFMKDQCIDLRRTGSAALDLCYAASGRCGLYLERVLQAWDFAAASCILKEAGGVFYNFEGEEPDYTRKSSAVAGCKENVEEFFSLYEEFQLLQAQGKFKF